MTISEVMIGEIVIGNEKADSKYSITRGDWIGRIVECSRYEIKVQGLRDKSETYWVYPECFDYYVSETDKDIFMDFLLP